MSRHDSSEDWIAAIPSHREMLANRVRKRDKVLRKWAQKQRVTAYRVYDHDIPEIPLYIERFNDTLTLSWKIPRAMSDEGSDPERHPWLRAMCDAVTEALSMPRGAIYVRIRRPTRHRTQYEKRHTKEERIVVQEGDAKLYVNLRDYVDTGLFLDHRPSRLLLNEQAKGKKVLNLFGYTGAFAVQAACGGAASTLTLDLSTTYTTWAEDNYRLNGIAVGRHHRAEAVDVMDWLQRSGWAYGTFDWIILDPPTTSRSKKMAGTLDIQRDQAWLLARCADLLSPAGSLLFSTNYRKFRMSDEHASIFSSIKETTSTSVPDDFPYSHPHRSWMLQK